MLETDRENSFQQSIAQCEVFSNNFATYSLAKQRAAP